MIIIKNRILRIINKIEKKKDWVEIVRGWDLIGWELSVYLIY